MTRLRGIFILSLVLLLQISCKQLPGDINLDGTTILLDHNSAPHSDSIQEKIISTYREQLSRNFNRIVAFSAEILEKGTPEGKLNNFVADLVFLKGKALYHPSDNKPIDFCLLNYGGLRVSLPMGEITYSRVFELLPFENEMVVVTLTGQKTFELFQYLAKATEGMPVAGLRLTIRNNSPESILINGAEFDRNRNYKVLTSDYLAGGGDSMNFFLNPVYTEILGMRVRDAIFEHMETLHTRGERISATLDGRIQILNR